MLQSLRGQVLPPREGAGPLPAFLLDLGASYLSSNYPLPFPGREQGDATKFDSMNLINTVRVKEINDERFTESGSGASTDTKSAIGGTRMSEAATPAVAAGNRVSTTRIVGVVAVAYAASLVVQNAWFLLGGGAPTYADPLGEVLAYHAENRGAVAAAVGQEAVNLPLLLLFVTGLHGLVQRRGGAGADWSRL